VGPFYWAKKRVVGCSISVLAVHAEEQFFFSAVVPLSLLLFVSSDQTCMWLVSNMTGLTAIDRSSFCNQTEENKQTVWDFLKNRILNLFLLRKKYKKENLLFSLKANVANFFEDEQQTKVNVNVFWTLSFGLTKLFVRIRTFDWEYKHMRVKKIWQLRLSLNLMFRVHKTF
jgi:hypothetical protein